MSKLNFYEMLYYAILYYNIIYEMLYYIMLYKPAQSVQIKLKSLKILYKGTNKIQTYSLTHYNIT